MNHPLPTITPPDDSKNDNQSPVQLTEAQVLRTLEAGRIDIQGLLPYSSNHSFLVTVNDGEQALPAVYKPRHGESPLWDFDHGTLCNRETAAYQVSLGLDWHLVPPTILRQGPHGPGSVQFYVENDPNIHYFSAQADARFSRTMRQITLFDAVINNADRKSGHCLVSENGRMWAIDHGICFHREYKLRTVIWEFSNQSIAADLLDDLAQFQTTLTTPAAPITQALAALLTQHEMHAMGQRLMLLLVSERYPSPLALQRNFPWPPI